MGGAEGLRVDVEPLEPRVCESVARGDALAGVLREQGVQQVLGALGHVVPLGPGEGEAAADDELEGVLDGLAGEGVTLGEHDVQDDADGPGVDDGAVRLLAEHLWGDVVRRATWLCSATLETVRTRRSWRAQSRPV